MQWQSAVDKLAKGVTSLEMREYGGNAPLAVTSLLDEVLAVLTHFDYRSRAKSFEWVRRKVWSAIRVMENQRMADRSAARAKELRRLKQEKAIAKDARLNDRFLKRVKSC